MLGQEWPEGWTRWAARPESLWAEPRKEDREIPLCINIVLLNSHLGQQHRHKAGVSSVGEMFYRYLRVLSQGLSVDLLKASLAN